ncbi:hypothetical protein FACS1894166_02140 [Bacilli bacterium]|nr:hypothetical protein FACS1894166_02140 [Bacilli bacterium]
MEFVHKLYKSSTTMDDLVIFVYAFGIEKFCRMKVNKLSGGQQQRLNAMLSLFHNPEILLLDELCNNLDLNIKQQIIAFIKTYIKLKNITAIIISHDVYEISHMSNRVIVIKDRRIFFDDTIKNIQKGKKTLDTIVAESI